MRAGPLKPRPQFVSATCKHARAKNGFGPLRTVIRASRHRNSSKCGRFFRFSKAQNTFRFSFSPKKKVISAKPQVGTITHASHKTIFFENRKKRPNNTVSLCLTAERAHPAKQTSIKCPISGKAPQMETSLPAPHPKNNSHVTNACGRPAFLDKQDAHTRIPISTPRVGVLITFRELLERPTNPPTTSARKRKACISGTAREQESASPFAKQARTHAPATSANAVGLWKEGTE